MTRDLRRAAAAVAVAIAVIGLLYVGPVYRELGPRTGLWIYDVLVVASAWAGVVLAFRLWRSFTRGEVLRRIWGSLALWLVLWAVGEAIWSYDQLVGGERLPYPSLADAAWIAGYVAVAVGLSLRYRSFHMTAGRGRRYAFFWSFVTLASLVVALVTIPIVRQIDPSRVLEGVVNVLYPIGDLAITIGALWIALLLIGGALSVPWGILAAGLLAAAVSDLMYVFAVSQGTYQVEASGGVNLLTFAVNVLYAASYMIVDAGLYIQGRLQKVI